MSALMACNIALEDVAMLLRCDNEEMFEVVLTVDVEDAGQLEIRGPDALSKSQEKVRNCARSRASR